jgi:hypothetical protein
LGIVPREFLADQIRKRYVRGDAFERLEGAAGSAS